MAVAPAQHSSARPDWGTMMIVREFGARILAPAARTIGAMIDLDYASSEYWQAHWPPGMRPANFLDGRKGRDVLIEADRRKVIKQCGAGLLNAPGLAAGGMVQQCWELFEADHRSGWLDSGLWVGFSLEQFASVQGWGERSPLSSGITTLVPSRRGRYLLPPFAMEALLMKKMKRHLVGSAERKALRKKLKRLNERKSDSPIPGDAPPHASYLSILWSHRTAVRRRQVVMAQRFLAEQARIPKAFLQTVAVIGGWPS
jgi:hypothetical protein